VTNGEEETLDGGGEGDVTPSTAERVKLWAEVNMKIDYVSQTIQYNFN
jgi:hypothetical protein